MATTTAQITVEEFVQLPDPPSGHYELRYGETVHVPPPKLIHTVIQQRILALFAVHLNELGLLAMEFPFRIGERNFRIADVAFAVAERIGNPHERDYFAGSPEIVVEVLSPANTAQEISEREILCLENGCVQFWVVDSRSKTIKISTPDRLTKTYLENEVISLSPIAKGQIAVADVFKGL